MKCGQIIFDKEPETHSWGKKKASLINGAEKNGKPLAKKMKLCCSLSPCTKINSIGSKT